MIYKLSERTANKSKSQRVRKRKQRSNGEHKNVEKKSWKSLKKYLTNEKDCDILYKLSAREGSESKRTLKIEQRKTREKQSKERRKDEPERNSLNS